jgi:hypothetical protein
MNPNYLLKDELNYELGVRGIKSKADTQQLRKLFRSLVHENLYVEVSYLHERGFQELYQVALNKILEFQKVVDQQDTNLSRLQTRAQHLTARVAHLELAFTDFQFSASEQRSVRRLLGLLADVERKMAAAQDPHASQVFLGDDSSNEEGQNPGKAEQLVHEMDAQTATSFEVRSTDPVTFPSPLKSKFYQKIPHPLSNSIEEMPTIDGSQIDLVWEFVIKASRLCKMGHFNAPLIYEVLYPYCKGEALELLTQSLTQNLPFDSFHARLINRFIPERQLAELRTDKYERVQAEREPLGQYIQAIRDAAFVLRITEPEAQMVSRILEGLNHAQRARFVFQTPPSTLTQL